MDAKPADEFELDERPVEDANDDFAGTLPNVPEETETSLDTSMREDIDLKVEKNYTRNK